LTGIDTKFSFGQSQPCEMSSRPIKKGSSAWGLTRRRGLICTVIISIMIRKKRISFFQICLICIVRRGMALRVIETDLMTEGKKKSRKQYLSDLKFEVWGLGD